MTTNNEWTLTENIEAWLSILPRCRAWNARAHAARETWNLTLRGPVVEWVSVKLNDLRRPQVLEQVRVLHPDLGPEPWRSRRVGRRSSSV